jgi:hypothetical protein
VRAAEVLGDGEGGHELAGGVRAHLWAVVGHGEQQRQLPVVDGGAQGVALAVGQGGPQRGAGPGVGQGEQVLGVEGGEEGDLDLHRGLLGRHQRGQPLAGDHVQDRDRGPAGPGEVSEVVGPDPVGLPLQPVRPGRARCRFARRIALQHKAFGGQHAAHGGLRDVHQLQPGAAVGQLAVRPVDLTPGLEQGEDRGAFCRQQAVHRVPARWGVGEPATLASGLPAGLPGRVQAEPVRGPPGRPAGPFGVVDQVEQAAP